VFGWTIDDLSVMIQTSHCLRSKPRQISFAWPYLRKTVLDRSETIFAQAPEPEPHFSRKRLVSVADNRLCPRLSPKQFDAEMTIFDQQARNDDGSAIRYWRRNNDFQLICDQGENPEFDL
jgi:hypothetical protein